MNLIMTNEILSFFTLTAMNESIYTNVVFS